MILETLNSQIMSLCAVCVSDRSGAQIALIIGEQEVEEGTISIRMLRDRATEQIVVQREDVVSQVRQLLGLES